MTTFIENEPPESHIWLYIYSALIALFLSLLLCSCKTTYIPIIEREYISKSDTITRIDSIFISSVDTILINGDSVTTIRWRQEFRYIDRYKVATDTIIKTDTISVPTPVEVKLTWWQRVKVATWPYMIVALIIVSALLLWLIRRKT